MGEFTSLLLHLTWLVVRLGLVVFILRGVVHGSVIMPCPQRKFHVSRLAHTPHLARSTGRQLPVPIHTCCLPGSFLPTDLFVVASTGVPTPYSSLLDGTIVLYTCAAPRRCLGTASAPAEVQHASQGDGIYCPSCDTLYVGVGQGDGRGRPGSSAFARVDKLAERQLGDLAHRTPRVKTCLVVATSTELGNVYLLTAEPAGTRVTVCVVDRVAHLAPSAVFDSIVIVLADEALALLAARHLPRMSALLRAAHRVDLVLPLSTGITTDEGILRRYRAISRSPCPML